MISEDVAKVCKCLSDLNRVKILEFLVKGESCACDILEELSIQQSTLSYHMKLLSECNLVNVRDSGKWTYYSINCETFKRFKNYLNGLNCALSHKEIM